MRHQGLSMPMSQIHGKIAIEATHKRLALRAHLSRAHHFRRPAHGTE
jgi:hypothetical protein